ncbi:flagellar export protein FliJ [Dyella sp.]|uniref:flagellar export protein FliJ n=1 Tax=Dyella sp. TaxID=1869338 RepID=UPI002ED1C55B
MKSRAARLQPAADQARERQELALQRLAEQQQKLARSEQQLAELHRYRDEYATNTGDLNVTALLNRQRFVERIDQAIAQQSGEVERNKRLLEHAGGLWREAHARERALDSVIDHHREQERKSEERREQSEIDERMQYRRPR